MPTHRKPRKNHDPIGYEVDLDRIAVYCDSLGRDFLAVFERWKLRPLEVDDLAALVEQVKCRLIRFALDCNALPVRTPRDLIATIQSIARKPYEFQANAGNYDPEAIARIYGKIASRSVQHAARLAQFDLGTGPAPCFDDIVQAASEVLADLEPEAQAFAKGGGQKLVLQHELTRDLAKIFKGYGGRVTRSTHFDPDKPVSYFEVGPFHDFLKLVLPVARPFARNAGFKMDSIRSLVSELQQNRIAAQK